MQQKQFLDILKIINSLTAEQIAILKSSLPEPDTLDMMSGFSQVMEVAAANFHDSPHCPRCNSESVGGWGCQNDYPRYKCHDCKRTFNAMTNSPFARLHLRDKLDQYINCMRGHTTLREAAEQCDISLPTSFAYLHRFMAVIQADKAELLTGITEIDETFFIENHKGERGLGTAARKRGKRPLRGKKKVGPEVTQMPVKKIPVMVACDRQNHVTDAVLEHVSADELEAQLKGRIQPGSVLCADAHLSHESLAKRLNLNLKELVITAGIHMLEKAYHIQHVNAYHCDLKSWIDHFFNGVATKNLPKYLGWKRFIKTERFSESDFLERVVSHWIKPLLN